MSSFGTAPAVPPIRMSVAGPPPNPPPPRPGPPPCPAPPGPPPRPPAPPGAAPRPPPAASGLAPGEPQAGHRRSGRPVLSREDRAGVPHAFTAKDDPAGLDRERRRQPVLPGPQQHRAAEPVPVEWQRGDLVDRGLDMRRVVAGNRPNRFLDGHRRNRHPATAVARMRAILDRVAQLVGDVDQLAVRTGVNLGRGRGQVLALRPAPVNNAGAIANCKMLRRERSRVTGPRARAQAIRMDATGLPCTFIRTR